MYSSEMRQDSDNWQALKDGKPEALSAIFHQYYEPLCRYGQKLTGYDSELTKEIIQDLFFKIWERRTHLGDVRSVKVYLFMAFRRALIDKNRHFMLEEAYSASLTTETALDNSPEAIFLIKEQQFTDAQKLKKAMLKLPNRIQEAITLRYFEEMSYSDIAEVMNLKERTVYNFVHEGLNLLRKAFVFFFLTTDATDWSDFL